VSDKKLRELEREWQACAGDFAHESSVSVTYLAELLRVGEVRLNEATLAWRQYRVEAVLKGDRAAIISMGSGGRVGGIERAFNPESPHHACAALWVLFGRAPVLSTGDLRGPQGEPGESISMEFILDSIRGILAEGGPRPPHTPGPGS
jgi:hypothetical protein